MLLDTSAWVEFFIGSKKGRRVKEVLNNNDCYSSIVTLAELSNWSLKEVQETRKLINTVKELSNIIDLDEDISILAGKLNFERKRVNKKWGMLDSFILATGAIYGLNVLTADKDFEDVPYAEIM